MFYDVFESDTHCESFRYRFTDLKPEDEITALRDETKLLRNLMIYERHRREILGMRNRRLLGKTKSSRILEEQNTALRDQLTTMYREVQRHLATEIILFCDFLALCREYHTTAKYAYLWNPRPSPSPISVTKSRWTFINRETASLLDQLETVRKEKHEVEEARAMAAKQRVAQIEELVSENGNLKEEVRVLNERLRAQADEMGQVRREMSLVESALFRANSEVRIGSYGMLKALDMTYRNDWKLLFSLSVSSILPGFCVNLRLLEH